MFYIGADAWAEMHRGADTQRAARHLRDAEHLIPGEGKHLTTRLPRGVPGRPRAYAVGEAILGASDD